MFHACAAWSAGVAAGDEAAARSANDASAAAASGARRPDMRPSLHLGCSSPMDALLAFAAALVSLRLTADLLRRYAVRRSPELLAWSASLGAYAIASAALAWGAAAGWSEAPFRLYYLCGGLLTAALLGAGSLVFAGVRLAAPAALVYAGLAIGVAVAVPLTSPVSGSSIPDAADHLDVFPARVLAIAGNSVGTIAAVAV